MIFYIFFSSVFLPWCCEEQCFKLHMPWTKCSPMYIWKWNIQCMLFVHTYTMWVITNTIIYFRVMCTMYVYEMCKIFVFIHSYSHVYICTCTYTQFHYPLSWFILKIVNSSLCSLVLKFFDVLTDGWLLIKYARKYSRQLSGFIHVNI